MPDLLAYLIENCLHDPKGDAKTDISTLELEKRFDSTQVTYLKAQGLLESAPVPTFLRCSECGHSCTAPIIRDSGRYFLFCEDYSSRRELEPEEVERWQLSLTGLGGFIAGRLNSKYRGTPTEHGMEICLSHGYLHSLTKPRGGWVLQIENSQISLSDLLYWKKGQLLIKKQKLSEALAYVKEYKPPEKKWTDEKLLALLEEHASLKGKGEFAPTKTLAERHNLSESQIKRLLTQARGIDKK